MHSRKGIRLVLCLLVSLSLPSLTSAVERPQPGQGMNNHIFRPSVGPIQVQPATLAEILQCLVGPNVEVSNAVLTAAPGTAGLFTNAVGIIGLRPNH